jgi:hypothetical protein
VLSNNDFPSLPAPGQKPAPVNIAPSEKKTAEAQ